MFGDDFFKGGIFGEGSGPRGRWRGSRMFGQGDLRLVILRLLDEKPRHGYEIIKALEERFAGCYAPSPGVVYPTLQLLEDQGFARVMPGGEGKKVYEITDAGRAHLAENQDNLETIFERVGKLMGHFLDEQMTEVHSAFRRAARATYAKASSMAGDSEALHQVSELLDKVARDIEALGKKPG